MFISLVVKCFIVEKHRHKCAAPLLRRLQHVQQVPQQRCVEWSQSVHRCCTIRSLCQIPTKKLRNFFLHIKWIYILRCSGRLVSNYRTQKLRNFSRGPGNSAKIAPQIARHPTAQTEGKKYTNKNAAKTSASLIRFQVDKHGKSSR